MDTPETSSKAAVRPQNKRRDFAALCARLGVTYPVPVRTQPPLELRRFYIKG
jgi:hypothetical protein